jgi:hypothetical protein
LLDSSWLLMYIEFVAVMGDEIEGRLHMRSALPNDTVGKSLGKAITGRSCKRLLRFCLPRIRQGALANGAEISRTHQRQSFQQDQLERARLAKVLAQAAGDQ